jgi:hypothetical protein
VTQKGTLSAKSLSSIKLELQKIGKSPKEIESLTAGLKNIDLNSD